MKSKQTAVEWLINEIIAKDWWYLPESMKQDIIEQAKQMEKEQIQHSYETGARYALISQSDLALIKGKFPNPTEFYNETFKS